MDTDQRIKAVRERLRAMQIDERLAEATGSPCVECRHYCPPAKPRGSGIFKPQPAFCNHIAHSERSFDPTTGVFRERREVAASDARSVDGLCGPEGLLFEPHPVLKLAFQRFNRSWAAIPTYALGGAIILEALFGR